MRLVFGEDQHVAGWVVRHIPHMAGGAFVAPYTAIGVVDSDGLPVAGVVWNQYNPGIAIEVSMAATSPRWAQRGVIRALLSYPFLQLKVNKVFAIVPHTSARTLRFLKGIGFVQEAILAQHFSAHPKVHAIVSRLFRADFDRLYMRPRSVKDRRLHGQISTEGARAA